MYTINQIHNTILKGVSDDYQKTEGFPTYDITRGVSFGQYQLWKKAFLIEEKQNVDNLEGPELDDWCMQRVGIMRNAAVSATATVKIIAGTGRIIRGDLFETEDGVQFAAAETKTVAQGDTVIVKALSPGTEGNVAADTIVKMPVTINGIGAVTNPAPLKADMLPKPMMNFGSATTKNFRFLQRAATNIIIWHGRRPWMASGMPAFSRIGLGRILLRS